MLAEKVHVISKTIFSTPAIRTPQSFTTLYSPYSPHFIMNSSNDIKHPSHKGKCIICPDPSCNRLLERNEEAKLHVISHFPHLLAGSLWLYYFNFCKMCKHYTIQKTKLKQHMWNIHKQSTLDPKYTGLGGNDFTMGPNRIPTSWAEPNPRIVELYRENDVLPIQEMRSSHSRSMAVPGITSVHYVHGTVQQPVWNPNSASPRSHTFPLAPGFVSSASSLSDALGPSPLLPVHNANRQSSDGSLSSPMMDVISVRSFNQTSSSYSPSLSEVPRVSDTDVSGKLGVFIPQGTAFVEEPLEALSLSRMGNPDSDVLALSPLCDRDRFEFMICSMPRSPLSDEARWPSSESAQFIDSPAPLYNTSQEENSVTKLFAVYINQDITA
ncbi:hypothetical protein QCA50_014761 [Cerrena zonata]|uniref:C2H2-type domain-containing protein n=1 Tax=Cerrena zonata TaxID=2478898 RepID=A0AAW0FSZ1_9APHY